MLFRPSESSERITEFYRRYLLTTFSTNKSEYNRQLKEALNQPKAISDGPYISMTDPYKKGMSLQELASEGVVSKSILSIDGFHPTRSLYSHQEEAVRKAKAGKNLVVTTGTGSGKTESFLIPVINQLLTEDDNGTLDAGVRTLIIYPMNALVNDQIRRLRELLNGTNITFGRFTGETKPTYKEAKKLYEEIELTEAPAENANELISREQMRKTPPNILITNYAMLEFMLLRPGDNIIFSETNANKWKYIVFDEAHSYSGAKGIEVSALTRRVKAMLNRDDIKFILTSATLGDKDSNSKIISFAEALCGAHFEDESIIRSKTIVAKPLREVSSVSFDIYRELAELVRNNYPDKNFFEKLKQHGIACDESKSIDENLYDLVLHDDFYYGVRKVLYRDIKTVKKAASELGVSESDFTDFIAVASNAISNGERLFEAKYHMFLRGIEGVFVTLNPSNKLFTQKMNVYKENPFDETDEGYQAYEVSFCSNCNALYITGEIAADGKLVQRSKYKDDYTPQVFLLSGEYDEEDDIEVDENTYTVCAVCGSIIHADSINGLQCGHDKFNFNKLIMVKDKNETLHKCACCGSVNTRRSIIRPYYLGNEAATAVISTGLYNELPSSVVNETVKEVVDPFFGETFVDVNKEVIPRSKQFLAFSDNRQSAAFFASYLDSTYRDTLIKRIIYSVVEEYGDRLAEGVSLNEFVNDLSKVFIKSNIFPELDKNDIKKEAWKATIKEMSNYKARNSMMRVAGLVFEADITLPNPLKGIDLSLEETTDFIKMLVRTVMKESAVKPGVDFLPSDEKEVAISGSIRGYLEIKTNNKFFSGWRPDDGKTNQRLKYVTKVLGSEDTAREFLRSIWRYLINGKYFISHQFSEGTGYLLNPEKIIVKKVNNLFRCKDCCRVTPYNIKALCENGSCSGNIEPYDYVEEYKDHHYAWIYKNLDMVPMTVKEHTAQLSNDQAYDYQRQFKEKTINVLSCSTTFEMGVDVGSLETVFMRNMPPSPANYAQRAGRAGRSLQSAAYALTYCPNSSHDLNYFRNPVTMIEGTIVPPFINIGNDKIVLRHIFASAFSYFWKEYESLYFEGIGEFIDAKGYEKFKEYLETKPEALKKYLQTIVPKDLLSLFDIENFGWIDRLFCEDYDQHEEDEYGYFTKAIESYNEDLNELRQAEKMLDSHEEKTRRDAVEIGKIASARETIKDQKTIEFLSKNNLIPKYGFPVDTVELKAAGHMSSTNRLNLSRDLMTAISEYAPGSEVIADGMRIKSRYIRKLPGHDWMKYNYSRCKKCSTLNRVLFVSDLDKCKQCGEPLVGKKNMYLIPKFGFLTDTEDPQPVGLTKPEKTYHGVVSYIGDEDAVEFHEYKVCGSRIILGNSRFDKLAVLNEAPFYVCETCGYTKLNDNPGSKTIEHSHKNSAGYRCQTKHLNNYSLGHEFKTDVAHIKFADFDIADPAKAWTILYSLLEGLSRSLNINRNEISGCIQWYSDIEHPRGNFGFVLFDNTPGGAGYVRQLTDPIILVKMLKEGYRIVDSCTCGGEEGDAACYSCLCNYYNQKQHDIIKRKYALSFFRIWAVSHTDDWDVSKNEEIYVKQPVKQPEMNSGEGILATKILNKGINLAGESYEYIWNTLLEDCEEYERKLLEPFIEKLSISKIEKPLYREQLEIIETGETIQPVFIWPKSKVMLFIEEFSDDYEVASTIGWKCFNTMSKFSAEDLIRSIEVK